MLEENVRKLNIISITLSFRVVYWSVQFGSVLFSLVSTQKISMVELNLYYMCMIYTVF